MALVVKSKIKESVKDMNVSSEFAEALDKQVASLIEKAVERAKANNRKTVYAKDL